MTRGNKFANTIIGALMVFSTPLSAGSAGRAIETNTGKDAAPTKEDGVDFLSRERKGASPEAKLEADALRVKTMSSINLLLQDKRNSRQEFELSLRLGELHVERADYLRDLEIQSYVASFEAWDKADPKTRAKEAPKAVYKNSETSLYNAVQVFRVLVNKFATHPRTDAALFSLARTLGRLNDDNAVEYYKQLITNHPKSELIPDAWLALGEFHFDKFNIKEATAAYQKAMEFKDHPAHSYSVYKLGWCFYNSQGPGEKVPGENLRKSIAAFKLVVKLSDKETVTRFKLRDEAIRDLVMAFAEAEDTEGAWAYFKENGLEPKFFAMLERLGGIYANNGKSAKAVEIYNRLVREAPTRKGNPQIHKKLVEIYDELARFPDATATIKIMQSLYAKESGWTSANRDNLAVLKGARDMTERTAYRFGTLYHSRGQKIKNPELEAEAAKIYTIYLQSFAELEAAYQVRYYLADIQMAQKNYIQASSNFIMVARQKPKDGAHLKDAAFNAVEAVSILNSSSKFAPVPPPGQAPSQLEIPKVKGLYASTLDFYVDLLPKEPAAMAMRYTAAQIYFDYGHYPEAIKRFDAIATKFSGTKQGQASARTIIAYYSEKSDWDNVVAYGKKFIANKEIVQDENVKKFIDDSLRTGIFNSAVASEKAQDYLKAANLFLEFQKMYPKNSNADRAIYNASLNQFKAGNVEQSIASKKFMLEAYPKSELAADVTASMSETYEAIAQFKNAADSYRRFAAMFPNDKRAPIALYNSGVLYRGVKQSDLAAESFADLYRKYPKHPAANDALFESARIKEAKHDMKGALADFNLFGSNPANQGKDDGLFALAKTIELRLASDPKSGSAHKDLAKLMAVFNSKAPPAAPAARHVIAKYLFEREEAGAKAFALIPLNNGKLIESQAAAKQAKLVALNSAYQEIIRLRNAEYSVASHYRLGELHEGFASALVNAPAPANASQKDAAAFKSQLEKAAFGLKDEAYKFYEAAYLQSSEVETFTSWTQKTYQKMVQLAPQKHPVIEEQSASPGYMSFRLALNPATNGLADQ
jgi:cellulose synthase operon protein C